MNEPTKIADLHTWEFVAGLNWASLGVGQDPQRSGEDWSVNPLGAEGLDILEHQALMVSNSGFIL